MRKVILELGYQLSTMDPCVFKLMGKERLPGLLIVEVDDILSLGDERHEELVTGRVERSTGLSTQRWQLKPRPYPKALENCRGQSPSMLSSQNPTSSWMNGRKQLASVDCML